MKLCAALVMVGVLGAACGTDPALSSAPAEQRTVRQRVVTVTRAKVEPARVSASCEDAMRLAAAKPDPEAAEPLIQSTLSACSSVAEWFAGLHLHPGAMGLKSAEFVQPSDVEVACHSYPSTPVCLDAAELGML